ncbi:tyrosine-type recombinase/integrase [Microbacterium sp.]|uniref:tyrosine-type recombinase/integrase n=1 Tax=Microbacterium sp. TaxID=51671 RepID=UPI0028120733|nr:tyrosine-type recombinase/integrase [Microbacterium sp.]
MLNQEWLDAIAAYDDDQKAGGKPPTTRRSRREHLQHLARRVHAGPYDLTADELVAYAAAQSWAVETRRGRRNTFLSFYRWAVRVGHVQENVAEHLPKVPIRAGRARPAPDRVYHEALMRASHREQLMLRLAAEVGMRRAEVAQAHSDDLVEDLVGWSLIVHGKGDRIREVPLPPSLATALLNLPRGYFFPGQDHGHLSPRYVGKLLAERLPEGWTMHTLRHRFATRLYALRSDLLLVQETLGHASPSTTRRYVEYDRTRMRAAIEELEASDVRYA